MNKSLKFTIRKRWLYTLFEISDIEFQKRLWIDSEFPNIISSHTELICCYFDDLNLTDGYYLWIKEGIITQKEAVIITTLHNLLENYTRPEKENLTDNKILLDPEWHIITKEAKKVWNELKKVISILTEIEYMNKLEDKYS